MRYILLSLFVLMGATFPAAAQDGPFDFTFTKLDEGVWMGERPDGPRFPVMGNTVFVIGEKSVLVFDGGGVPGMADQIIEKVKSLTDLPVSHVVISHWHGDHNFGIYRFGEAFPNVQFIAQDFTARAMDSAKIDYVKGYADFVEKRMPRFREIVKTGIEFDGSELTDENRKIYLRIFDDADEIDKEYKRVRLTTPNLVFADTLSIDLGNRTAELLTLGHGNTEGEAVLWLPKEKLVATGDLIVLPSPYAFNVPPRKWAATLTRLNALGYQTLVPGHGPAQTDQSYVNLVKDAALYIADQRDNMITEALPLDEVEKRLNLDKFERQFTNGDEYVKVHFDGWFEGPLVKAAIKELSGEPMVKLEPRKTE